MKLQLEQLEYRCVPAATVSIADANVVEGGAMAFQVSLSEPVLYPTFVRLNTATASIAGAYPRQDYSPTTTTLRFNPGETVKFFSVSTTLDATQEADEIFFGKIAGAYSVPPGTVTRINLGVTDAQAVGTIIDDDPLTGAGYSLDGGVLTITGTGLNDNVGIMEYQGQLLVQHVIYSNGANVYEQAFTIPLGEVTTIKFASNGGADRFFDNSSSVLSQVFGADGDDVLFADEVFA